MHNRFLNLACGLLLAMASTVAPAQLIDLPDTPECTAATTPGVLALSSVPVRLDVRVLLDGVSQQRAQQIVSIAQQAYSPQQLTLRASYETRNLSGTDGAALIQQAKARYGYQRPAGVDMVYVLTSKDITDATQGNTLAGLADCIGGVAYADRAFAVGEATDVTRTDLVVYALGVNFAAKTLAHEIGHLLGAQHHYANCAEGATGDGPCTLMFNVADIQKLEFSTLNSTVVRGYAQQYATP